MDTETKRERKSTVFFVAPTIAAKKDIVTAEGTGVKLGENEFFCSELNKFKGDDELVKALHSLMYNTPGRKAEAKKNIRNFSGFDKDTNKEEKVAKLIEKKKVWTVSLTKSALGLFGLEKSGDREKLIDRLVTYLLEPTITLTKGVSITPSKKRKSVSGSKTTTPTKSKKEKVRRAPSAYSLYVKAHSAEVKAANPDFTFADLSKHVAANWNALDHGGKELWNMQAADAKIAFDNANENEAASSKKKAKKSSAAEGADSGAEDEEALFKNDTSEEEKEAEKEEEEDRGDEDAGSEHEQYEQEE